MNVIEIKNLSKFYGKSRGITEVNLSVEKGEFFGFIGPNGAGKSTTIRTLLGLIFPTSGNAFILGLDVVNDHNEIMKKIGYLPSENSFYSGMRVRDIIKLSQDMHKMNCQEEAEKLCKRLELDTSRVIDELSFGNKKKVGIICALQHNPEILILDEPTSGLDPLMQREFFEILREKNKAGTTIFLSSHILSEIQRNCSRAAIIRDGSVIAIGSVEELSKTNAKRIVIHGNVDISSLEKVEDLKMIGDSISFLYGGDINKLVLLLSKNNITDLSISEPDLEEIFLHYYEKEGE